MHVQIEGDDTPENMGGEYDLPAQHVVCDDCRGEGRTLNENLRGAFTSSEFNECFDDESREEYMKGGAGIYGVTCKTCDGRRVVLVPDEDACRAAGMGDVLDAYVAELEDRREFARESYLECRREARMLGEWDGD